MKKFLTAFIISAIFMGSSFALAHVSPNVKLVTTKQAVSQLLPNGKLFLKNVHLNNSQVETLKSSGHWNSHETNYKFFVSRDKNNSIQRAVVFITEFTRHGPIVVAVSLDSNGKVMDAMVTDIQMETLEWVGPLIRSGFLKEFRGKGSEFSLDLQSKSLAQTSSMTRSFAHILANAIKRSTQLYQIAF
jgi:hypothetical protein